MQIKITSDGTPGGTGIFLEDGSPFDFVSDVSIKLNPCEVPMATLTFSMPEIDCVAYAIVSEEHLKELAARHGYELVKKADG